MLKQSVLALGVLLLAGAAQPTAQQPAAARRSARRRTVPSIDDRVNGLRKIDGYFPLYWDERTGSLLPRDPAVRHRLPVHHRPLGRPRLERHRPRPRPGGGGPHRRVPARRPARACWCRRNQSFRSSSTNPLERKSVEDSFAKSVLWGFTVAAEIERPRARGRHRLLPARRARRRRGRCGRATIASIARAARSTCRTRRTFPKNTEVDMTLTFVNEAAGGGRGGGGGPAQGPAPIGAGGGGGGGGRGGGLFSGTVASVTPIAGRGDDARARVVRRAARRQLQAAHRRSARRLRRPQLRRLQRADRRADRQCATSAAIACEKKDPTRGDERAGEADSVLGRLRARRKT